MPIYTSAKRTSNDAAFVSIDEPVAAFGEVLVAEPQPVIQADFVYGINDYLVTTTVANGGAVNTTDDDGNAKLSTSVATNGSAVLETIKRARYRPGQGRSARFTAIFTTGQRTQSK